MSTCHCLQNMNRSVVSAAFKACSSCLCQRDSPTPLLLVSNYFVGFGLSCGLLSTCWDFQWGANLSWLVLILWSHLYAKLKVFVVVDTKVMFSVWFRELCCFRKPGGSYSKKTYTKSSNVNLYYLNLTTLIRFQCKVLLKPSSSSENALKHLGLKVGKVSIYTKYKYE